MDEDLVFAGKMHICAESQGSSLTALREAVSMDSGSALRGALSSAYSKIMLGMPAGMAFREALVGMEYRDRALKARLACVAAGCGDAKSAMARVAEEVEHSNRLRLELGFGSAQKYMTLSLLSSVILPSLALFGFVGYSMLYSSPASFAAFSAVLLAVFPAVYALLRKRMDEVYG